MHLRSIHWRIPFCYTSIKTKSQIGKLFIHYLLNLCTYHDKEWLPYWRLTNSLWQLVQVSVYAFVFGLHFDSENVKIGCGISWREKYFFEELFSNMANRYLMKESFWNRIFIFCIIILPFFNRRKGLNNICIFRIGDASAGFKGSLLVLKENSGVNGDSRCGKTISSRSTTKWRPTSGNKSVQHRDELSILRYEKQI